VPVDPSGQSPVTETFNLTNFGADDLTLSSLAITSGSAAFAVSGVSAGTVLHSHDTAQLTISFDPKKAGTVTGNLRIVSNDPNSPLNITLTGTAVSATPSAHLELSNNNLGGVPVGSVAQSADLATVTNNGAQPLVITAIRVEAGGSGFALT